MSTREKLRANVDTLGEVHAIIAECDEHLEIRKGQIETWGDTHFTLKAPGTGEHAFAFDDVVGWYEPGELWHDPGE